MNLLKQGVLLSLTLLAAGCHQTDVETQFTLLSPETTGIYFQNVIQETPELNVLTYGYLYHGAGVAAGDLNNDGLEDLYFTGNMTGSHLYLNQGDFKFREIAREAGVFAEGLWNTGTTMADVNADGFLDIYVCRSAAADPNKRKNLLFINNGDLTFTEQAARYGIDDPGYSSQASFFDFDRDGDLDLYVLNHATEEYAGFSRLSSKLKQQYNRHFSDKLYRNDQGHFTDISEQAGLIANVLGFGLSVAISDINLDGWPDIFVGNDFNEQDYLYINNQDGTFTESLSQFMSHTSMYTMGTDIADLNNDGYFDIFTADMLPEDDYRQKMVTGSDHYEKYQQLVHSGFYHQTMRNMLQLNRQGTHFDEIGRFSGVYASDWSWAPLISDFDNDGHKDLYVTNGYRRDYTNMDFVSYTVQQKLNENKSGKPLNIMDIVGKMPSIVLPNYAFHNRGDLRFEKVQKPWGLDHPGLSNGAVYADLDNDGDQDLVVNNVDQPAFVYRNNNEVLNPQNRFLKLALRGDKQNTLAVGARVTVSNTTQTFSQELIPTRGYLSSVSYPLIFGLGTKDSIVDLTVQWPDGQVQYLNQIRTNQTLQISKEHTQSVNTPLPKERLTLLRPEFTLDSLWPVHRENPFVDFKRESLLPHFLSNPGPRIAVADVNGDALEDVYIGGAKGSPGSLWLQNSAAGFDFMPVPDFISDAISEDVQAVFFDADGDGDQDLLVSSGGGEFPSGHPALKDRLYLNSKNGQFQRSKNALPDMMENSTSVAVADIDGDGDQDLYIGSRQDPGHYPMPGKSAVLLNDGQGVFSDVTLIWNRHLQTPGMVTTALFEDLDSDNLPELILTGEWMPVRIFKNSGADFREITANSGLSESSGWWSSLKACDVDLDGDMDLVGGNFGLNSELRASAEFPLTLVYQDFDNNGSIDPVLCRYQDGNRYAVYPKDDLTGQLSMLKSKFVNYSDYAGKAIEEILGPDLMKRAQELKANTMASAVFLNDGKGKFKILNLPSEAQWAPVQAIHLQDLNQDSIPDLILGGNLLNTRVRFGSYDALKGLVLLGQGNGQFTPLNPSASGLCLPGETKDIAELNLADGRRIYLFARNNNSIASYTLNKLN